MRFIISVIILVLFCVSPIYALDKKGLMLYFPFEDGAGKVAKDVSGNGNNGDLKGSCEWVAGKYGKALQVHRVAGEYVEVPHSDSLDITKEITLELWAIISSMDSHCAFISKASADQKGAYILHASNDNGFYTTLVIFVGGVQGPWPPPAIGKTTLGAWHHFAGSYDGAELRIYVDGELSAKANRSVGGNIDHSDNVVVIGRDNRAEYLTSRNMDCIMDEVKIWNRVLSQDEIKESMTGKLISVNSQGLLANTWGEIKLK